MLCPSCGIPAIAGQFFGHYQVLRQIAAGGMGTVHEAIDSLTGRSACLKLLRGGLFANPAFVADFAREARIAASINHPNIVQIYEFAQHDGLWYLAMEFLDHGNLERRMKPGPIAESDLLRIALDVARGLQAASAKSLLHRDVKPGNILFDSSDRAKLVDFGLCVSVDEARRSQGLVWGSPYYIAPERLDGAPEDLRSDIYSLGATMFHAAAGRPLFTAASASLMAWKHLKAQKVSIRTFAPHLQDDTAWIINRCVQRNPKDRFPSYFELIEAIETARKRAAAALPASLGSRNLDLGAGDRQSSAKLGWVAATAAAAVLAASLATIAIVQSGRKDVLSVDGADRSPGATSQPAAPGSGPAEDPGTDIGSGWRSFQVGGPGHRGGTLSVDATSMSLWHEGQDVWGTADSCCFVYKQASGDVEMTLRVVESRNGHELWNKSGIMMRSNLDPGSPNVFLMVAPQSGTRLQRRQEPGGETGPNHKPEKPEQRHPPVWLKLVRAGNTVTAFDSLDGATGPWRQRDQIQMELPECVFLGPAICAHGAEFHCEADFDGIRLSD